MGSSSDRPSSRNTIDLDKIRTRMDGKTIMGIIVSAVVATAWVVSAYASAATKDDVVAAVNAHGESQHAKTVAAVGVLETVDIQQNADIAAIKSDVKRLKGIDSKLELLTRHAIMRSGTHTESTQLRRAANKIRMDAQQRGEDDPFEGIEFRP